MSELHPDFFDEPLSAVDPQLADVLGRELERQQNTLEMIASENFVSARFWRRPVRSSPTSTPRATRASATTVDASSPMWWRISPATAQNVSLVRNMPTCNRTRAPRQMLQPTCRCSRPAIAFWVLIWPTVAT